MVFKLIIQLPGPLSMSLVFNLIIFKSWSLKRQLLILLEITLLALSHPTNVKSILDLDFPLWNVYFFIVWFWSLHISVRLHFKTRYDYNLTIMMSRIDSRNRKISTGLHFQNGHHNTAKIQHCSISKVAFDLFFKPVVSCRFGRLHNR